MSSQTRIIRIILLGIFDVIAFYLAITLGSRISVFLGLGIGIFAIVTTIVFLDDRLFPWRWVTPALAGMFLLVVYPIGFSLVVAFSNFSDGHRLSKQQVLDNLLARTFQPENAVTYKSAGYVPPKEGATREDLIFWLIDPQNNPFVTSYQDQGLISPEEAEKKYGKIGEIGSDGFPAAIGDYARLNRIQLATYFRKRDATDPGIVIINQKDFDIAIDSAKAVQQIPEFRYDPTTDTLTSNQDGRVYRAERGSYVTGEGETRVELTPGYADFIGFDNILRVVRDPSIRDPFFRVFLWTIGFALGSVALTFALGLGFALVLNSKDLPLRTLWRSILIVPYAVPFWLSAKTWAALMNREYGPVSNLIESIFGTAPDFFADPALAKVLVLFVNLYLGFPYMMLITLGALQSIPSDMYEAATIDGASATEQFRFITLPLLLVAVGPLLVASFAFNFNNFTLIQLLTNGNPPFSAGSVAGHTDILLSYTYELAFGGATGNDYGFAAAVGIFIFLIVGTITFINFRFTRQLETAAQ